MALALDIEETSQMILRQLFWPIGVNGNELVLLSDTYLVARNSTPGACLFQVFGYVKYMFTSCTLISMVLRRFSNIAPLNSWYRQTQWLSAADRPPSPEAVGHRCIHQPYSKQAFKVPCSMGRTWYEPPRPTSIKTYQDTTQPSTQPIPDIEFPLTSYRIFPKATTPHSRDQGWFLHGVTDPWQRIRRKRNNRWRLTEMISKDSRRSCATWQLWRCACFLIT